MKMTAHEWARVVKTQALAAATTAGVAGTGVDCKGYRECLVILDAILAAANAEADIKIQESSDDGDSDTYADVSGAAFTQITPANDVTYYVARIDLTKRERYLRSYATMDGSNAFTGGVFFVLMDPIVGPATQVNSTVFNV